MTLLIPYIRTSLMARRTSGSLGARRTELRELARGLGASGCQLLRRQRRQQPELLEAARRSVGDIDVALAVESKAKGEAEAEFSVARPNWPKPANKFPSVP